MTDRIYTRLRIREEVLEYIKDFAEGNNLSYKSTSQALEQIIYEHKEYTKNNWSLQYISETVSESVKQSVQATIQNTISSQINKVRLGTNNVDRNTQILIELLQGYMQMQNMTHIMTTDLNKPDFLNDVENLVHNRITEQKIRRDSAAIKK